MPNHLSNEKKQKSNSGQRLDLIKRHSTSSMKFLFLFRALLDAKKQRSCRHSSSPSTLLTATVILPVVQSFQEPVSHSTIVGDSSSTSPLPPPPPPSSSSPPLALEVTIENNLISSHLTSLFIRIECLSIARRFFIVVVSLFLYV